MKTLHILVGPMASGKSTFYEKNMKKNKCLNRDTLNGKGSMDDVLRELKKITSGEDIVLDNTFPTVESRKPFIEWGIQNGYTIHCVWFDLSIEQSQINSLVRQYRKFGRLYLSNDDIKESGIKDPHLFPPAALFKYRKDFEKPTKEEGFSKITRLKEEDVMAFEPWPKDEYKNKALILDYDDTIRYLADGAEFKYPVKESDVKVWPERSEVLKRYRDNGYILLGASNQSGIAKGHLTSEMAEKLFKLTNSLLDVDIDFTYCPHRIPPANCYCRKPQSGMAVNFIEKYKLNPAETIFVGDQTSDETWANRIGFQFQYVDNFFKK